MIPLVVIRPQPACDESVAAASAMDLDARGFPLFDVHPMPWDMPEADSFDALLIGSANVLRHGGAALAAFAGKNTYAVGEKTAQACRDAGLDVIATGTGGLQDLLGTLRPDDRRLLRLSGTSPVPVTPPEGVTIVQRTVYASEPVPMSDALARQLRDPCVVMLHSAQAARHLRAECERHAIDLHRVSLAAIGPRVAQAGGDGWASVRTAQAPSEDALLALARQMCEEAAGSQPESTTTRQRAMQDQTGFEALAAAPRPRRSSRGQIAVALLGFLLGAAAVTWIAWRGYLSQVLPASAVSQQESPAAPASSAPAAGDAVHSARDVRSVGDVETRLALLEDRLSRLDLQADAASGNAARAESLLIAFAARRMIDRGEPLRYLADQLRLRFANAQPRAVETIIDFAHRPVTVDELSARLEALTPELSGKSRDESFWKTAMHDLSNMFVVHREASKVMSPDARIDRARVMLRSGRITEAIAEIGRLPRADLARTWIADAQRYADVQRALDLIETAAMLEPSRLQDVDGKQVNQPSPLASPAPTETPTPSPAANPAPAAR